MPVINFIKNYWVQIMFVCTLLGAMYKFEKAMIDATKCGLRNDMLSIYDRCKDKKQITKYQLQSFDYSYEQYKKLKGNSFIDDINILVHKFQLID